MRTEESLDIMWNAYKQGDHFPDALSGKLSMDDAYALQLGMLARRLEQGEQHAGWKVGLTAEAVRKIFGADSPVFGYLLKSGLYASGHEFPFDKMKVPCIESELCITMGEALKGPGVTRAQVLDAVASVAPSNEILERRGDMAADLPLGVADNVAQYGYAVAEEISPFPRDLHLPDIKAKILANGEVFKDCVSHEVIEDQLDSIAWLANKLSQFGYGLEAGQRIMSGSYYPPTPVNKGDQWDTSFSDVGEVMVRFL